jgi:hypothetical protein
MRSSYEQVGQIWPDTYTYSGLSSWERAQIQHVRFVTQDILLILYKSFYTLLTADVLVCIMSNSAKSNITDKKLSSKVVIVTWPVERRPFNKMSREIGSNPGSAAAGRVSLTWDAAGRGFILDLATLVLPLDGSLGRCFQRDAFSYVRSLSLI